MNGSCTQRRVCICDGSNFTCSIRQLFDATSDKMRYDEVTGDLTSSLSHSSVSSVPCADTPNISHYHADKVIFCCPSFLVVSFYLCLKREAASFISPSNTHTHTHTHTHSCCNDLTVSVSTLLLMSFIVLSLCIWDVLS